MQETLYFTVDTACILEYNYGVTIFKKEQNMEERHTSGGKQFLIVLIIAAILYILCGAMMSLFGSYAFVGGIISVLVFCVFGFFVLTHYTARFTYSVKNGRLRVNRTIGKRNREFEFACSDIVKTIYGEKPSGVSRPRHSMRISILSDKNSLYIEYKNKEGRPETIIIEPTDKLRQRIDKERKKDR